MHTTQWPKYLELTVLLERGISLLATAGERGPPREPFQPRTKGLHAALDDDLKLGKEWPCVTTSGVVPALA
jgi:hypothetical protein